MAVAVGDIVDCQVTNGDYDNRKNWVVAAGYYTYSWLKQTWFLRRLGELVVVVASGSRLSH